MSRGSSGPRNSSPASATRESQDQPLEKVLGGGMTYFALWLGFRCTGGETRDETMPASRVDSQATVSYSYLAEYSLKREG